MRYSVLDLGSNSFHWLTMEADEQGNYSTLFRTRKIFRLREGKEDKEYLITPEVMEGAITVIKEIMYECPYSGNSELKIIATSATREAANKEEFTSRIQDLTGSPVDIISGEDEARYIAQGIRTMYPPVAGTTDVIFDIGGGSTEVIFESDTPEFNSFHSLPLGSVRLMKRFFSDYNLTETGKTELKSFIEWTLREAGIDERKMVGRAIGSSGSINILNKLCDDYSVSREPGFVPAGFIKKIGADILKVHQSKERETIFNLEPPKAQIVPAGLYIIHYLLETYSLDGVWYSTANLKEGVILEMHTRYLNRNRH